MNNLNITIVVKHFKKFRVVLGVSLMILIGQSNLWGQAGDNDTIACDQVTLAATAVPGYWTVQLGGPVTISNSTDPNAVVSGISGDLILRWTYNGGVNTDDIAIIYQGASIITPSQNICGTSISLEADAIADGLTGTWSSGSANVTFGNSASNLTTAYNLEGGGTQLIWTVSSGPGCSSSDQIYVDRSIYAPDAGVDQTICGTSTTLNGSNPPSGVTGTWSLPGLETDPAIFNVNQRNTTISNITSFPLTVRWTYTGGTCDGSYDEMVIYSAGTTVAQIQEGDVANATCESLTYNVGGGLHSVNAPGAGETLTWYEAAPASGVTIGSPNAQVTTVDLLAVNTSATIVLQIEDANCVNRDTIVVNANTAAGVTANGGLDQLGLNCQDRITMAADDPSPYTGTWTVEAANPNNENVVIWEPNNPNTTVSTYNPSIVSHENSYSLVWTVSNGDCTVSDIVNIDNYHTAFATVTAGIPGYQPGDKEFNICDETFVTLMGNPQNSNSSSNNAGGWGIINAYDGAAFEFTSGGAGNPGCVPGSVFEDHMGPDVDLRITGLATGSVQAVWYYCYTQNGPSFDCSSSDTLTFNAYTNIANIAPYNTPGYAGADQNICGNVSTTDAVDPATDGVSDSWGYWSDPNDAGIIFANINSPSTVVTFPSQNPGDIYTLRWNVQNICSTTFDDVVVNINGATAASAGTDQDICENSTFMNAPEPAGTGIWSVSTGSGNFADFNSSTTEVTGLAFGRNVFVWSVEGVFCNTVDTVEVYSGFLNSPNPGNSPTVCETGQLQGQAPPNGTATWSTLSGSIVVDDVSDPSSTFTITSPTANLRWRVVAVTPEGRNCSADTTVMVYNNMPQQANAGVDPVATVCGSYQLGGNPPLAGETGLWETVGNGSTFDDETLFNTMVRNMDVGPNTYRWTLTKGTCTTSDEVTVTSEGVDAIINFPATNYGTCADSIQVFANDPSPGTGQWVNLDGGTFESDNSATTWAYLVPGTNRLRWTVSYGTCNPSTTIQVSKTSVTIPDADAFGAYPMSCDGTLNLNANSPVGGETGLWTAPFDGGINFATPSSASTTVSGLQSGNNTLVWSITDGSCTETDTITVAASAFVIEAGVPQNICIDNTTISGSTPSSGGPWSGQWTVEGGGGAITLPNSSTTTVTSIPPGTNTYRWTVTQGVCSWNDDVFVYMNGPSTPFAGLDDTICAPTTQLDADPPTIGTGYWTASSPAVVFVDSTDPLTNVSNLPGGLTTFTWTVTNGTCTLTDQVRIWNNSFSIGADDAIIWCDNNGTLSATMPPPGATGIWDVQYGAGTFTDPTFFNTTVTNVGSGDNIYRWRLSQGGCEREQLFTISNYELTAQAGPDTLISCTGTQALTGTGGPLVIQNRIPTGTPDLVATGTWWTGGAGTFGNINAANTTITGLNPDVNTITWTLDNGFCNHTDTVVVMNYTPTLADAGNDTTVCDTSYIHLNANVPTRGTGYWTMVSGGATTYVENTASNISNVYNLGYYAQPLQPDYWTTVEMINRFQWNIEYMGCVSTDVVEIINALPLPADAGVDQRVCASEVNMNALCRGAGAQEHWWTELGGTGSAVIRSPLPPNDPDNTFFNANVTNLQNNATSTFIWWKRNTIDINTTSPVVCTISDTMQVYSLGLSQDLSAGENIAVCDSTYILQADEATSVFSGAHAADDVYGFWQDTNPGSSVTFDDISNHNTTVRNLEYDVNILRWTIVNNTENCSTSDDVYVVNALPSRAQAGPNDTICVTSVGLTANRPWRGTGMWTIEGYPGSTPPTLSTSTCQGLSCASYATGLNQNGSYTFLWTVSYTYNDPEVYPLSPFTCDLEDTVIVVNRMLVSNPGVDQYVCNDEAQLNGTEDGNTGTWTITTGGPGTSFSQSGIATSTTASDPMVYNLQRGLNQFTWTITNGYCSDAASIDVWNDLPTTPVITGASLQTFCDDSVTISGNPITNGYGRWTSFGAPVTIHSSANVTTAVTGIPDQNSVLLIWNAYNQNPINGHNCVLRDTVTLFNNRVVAEAGSDLFVCGTPGGTAQINLAASPVTAPTTGQWTTFTIPATSSASIVSPTSNTSQVINMGNGDHQFLWTITKTTNGVTCTDNDIALVEVRIPTLANALAQNENSVLADSVETCVDGITLRGNNPPSAADGVGTWYKVTSGTETITNPSSNITTVTGLTYNFNKRLYEWVINNDGCISRDTAVVMNNMVWADAFVGSDADTSICVPDFTLNGTQVSTFNPDGTYPFQATGQWTANLGSINIDDNTLYNSYIDGLTNGGVPNILTWTITKEGCSASSDLVIYNNEFTISAGGPHIICENYVTMNGEDPGPGGTGQWTYGPSSSGLIVDDSAFDTQVTGITVGTNYYVWTIYRNGCSANEMTSVTNDQVIPSAGTDFTTCSNDTALNAIAPTNGTGIWINTVPGGVTIDDNTLYNTAISGLGEGLNTFRWIVSNATCSGWDEVNVVNNAPSTPNTMADREICSESFTIVADVPTRGSGTWSLLTGGGNIVNANSATTLVNNINPRDNEFLWTVKYNECELVDTLVLTNNRVVPNPGPDQIVCQDSTQLAAIDPSTYLPGLGTGNWTKVGGGSGIVATPSLENTWVTNLDFGSNTFRWTLTEGGCSDYEDVVITNSEVTANAGADIDECTFPVTLAGNNPVTNSGLWTNIGSYGTVVTPTQYNSDFDDLDNGLSTTLRWYVYNANCNDADTITVRNSNFSVSAGPPQALCTDTAQMNAADPGSGSGYWQLISGAGVFDNSTSRNTIVRNLGRGDNTFRWVVSRAGCTNYGDVTITNNSPTEAQITGPLITEVCDSAATLTAYTTTPFYGTGMWTMDGGSATYVNPTSFTLNVTKMALEDNIFVWTVTNNGCTDEDRITITNNAVIANAGADRTICFDNVQLSAADMPAGASGMWENLYGGSIVISNSSILDPVVTNLPNTTANFRWTVTKGICSRSDVVSITNRAVDADASSTPSTVCDVDATLSANALNAGETGYWEIVTGGPSFVGDPSNNVCDVTGLLEGNSYQFRWNLTNGDCSQSDNAYIINASFSDKANANGYGVTRNICTSTFTMSADLSAGGSGVWTRDFGNALIQNNTLNTSLVTNIDNTPTQFTWTVNKNGCVSTDQVTLVNNSITATATTPRTTCDGTLLLDGNNPAPAGTGLWEVITGSGAFSDPSSNSATVSGLDYGTNQLTWTVTSNVGGCTDAVTVDVQNNEFEVKVGNDQNICTDVALLSVPTTSGTGYWDVVGGTGVFDDSTDPNTYVRNLGPNANRFRWNASFNGCTGSDIITITNRSVSPSVLSSSIEVCGSTATLNANDATPNNGVWSVIGGTASIDDNTLPNTAVTLTTSAATFQWTVSNETCSAATTVSVENRSIDLGGDLTQSVCSSTANLIAPPLNTANGETGVWTQSGSASIANINSAETLVTNLASGSNLFFWTVTNTTGCSDAILREIVNNASTTAVVGSDQDICDDNTIIAGNLPNLAYESGLWTGGELNGVIINDPTNSSTAVSNLPQGATTFTWTITRGICAPSSANIIVTNNLFDVDAGVDQTQCSDSYTFAADDPAAVGGTGTWTLFSGAGLIANSTDHLSNVNSLGQDANTFVWSITNAAGCTVSDTVVITNNLPNIPTITADFATCNSVETITGGAPPLNATGSWDMGAFGSATIVNRTSNVTAVTDFSDGPNEFVWTIYKGACSSENRVTIDYNGVVASVEADRSTCFYSGVETIDATDPTTDYPGSSGTWSRIQGNGQITNSLLNSTTVTNLSPGANTFRWTVTRGICSDYDQITITNNAPSVANAGTNQNICGSSASLLATEPAIGTGTWSKALGSTATIADVTAFNTGVTLPIKINPYSETFRWIVENNGCRDTSTVVITNDAFENYANADDYSCDGTYPMMGRDPLTVSPGATGDWTVSTGNGTFNFASAYNAVVSNLDPDINTLTWTITNNGCAIPYDVIITNDEVTASGTGFMTCNNSASITANNPALQGATGTWSMDYPGGQSISNLTSFTTNVSNLVPNNINSFRWTVNKGLCSATDTVNVEYVVPNADITLPPTMTLCIDTVELRADPNIRTGTGEWSVAFGSTAIVIDNSVAATTVARNLDIGNNVFVWTVTERGCTNSDQVTITNNMPENTAGTDKAACDSVFLMDAQVPTGSGTGVWTLVSGNVRFIDPNSATTTVIAKPGTNIIEWTITENGCSASKRFNVVNNLTKPDAGVDISVCENRVQLSGSNLQTGETGLWSIDGGATSELFSNASINNPEVTNLRQGTVTFVWTVSNGICSKEDRVMITNNTPFVEAGLSRTICEDFVTLNGNNPAAGETGLWTIGSTTVNIANPTFYATNVTNLSQGSNLFTWTIDNGICEASDDVLITSNSVDVVAGVPYTEDCADTLYLEATMPPAGSTGYWSAVEGGGIFDNTASNATIARNLGSFNKLRWTITDGTCSFYDEIDFVSLLPSAATTSADKAVCNNFTQITATPADASAGETGIWTQVVGSAGVVIETPTSFQTDVTNLDQGVNVFRWTISNEYCNTSDDITITNNTIVADAGLDQTICDSSASISANVIVGSGVWSTTTPGVVIANSTNPNTTVSGLGFGTNSITWTLSHNGCTDDDNVTITSNLPRNVSAGSDQNICTGEANLTATNPGIGSGLWEVAGGNGVFANASANQTTVTNLASGENRFTWTVTVGSCSESSQVTINNNSLFVTAGVDQVICNQDFLNLNGTQPAAGESGFWTALGGSNTVFDDSQQYNTTVRNLAQGTTTLTWTLTDGSCSNSAKITVINNTPSPAVVEADKAICADNAPIAAQAVAIGTGRWSLTSGTGTIANISQNNTTVSGIGTGPNTYTWTVTKDGCSLSDNIVITNNSVDAFIANDEITICTSTHSTPIIANPVGAGETGTWSIAPGEGIVANSLSNATTVSGLGFGDTYLTWTVSNGSCSDFDQLRITDNYYDVTAGQAIPGAICVDYTAILGSPWPAGASGLWTSSAPTVTFDNNTLESTVARDLPNGTSSITWTVTKDGCASSATFSVVNNSVYTSAGENKVVCQPSTTLNAQELFTGETGYWQVDNASVVFTDSTDPATAVSGLINGNNTFTWTLTGNGCTTSETVIVENNQFSVVAGASQIVCGTSFNLAGTDPLTGTGLWTISSGNGRFANASNFETTVYDIPNGANTYTWTVNRNGCVASANITLTNDLYAAVAGDDRAICSNQTTVSAQPLNPIWGASGVWSAQTGGGIFTNPSSESTLVTGLANGENRLRWTVTKGACVSFDEIVITNNSIPAGLAGTNETTCNNFANLSGSFPPNASSSASGIWTGGGVTVTIVDPTLATTAVTGLQQGANTFAWTVTDKGCTGTSTVQITSNNFTARAGNDQILTVNSAVMTALLPDASATGTWTPISGAGTFADVNSPTSLVTSLGYGVNTFRWTVDWNSCSDWDDVNIIFNNVVADAGTDQILCTDRTYLNATDPSPAGVGTWTITSGGGTIVEPDNPTSEVIDIQPGSVNIYRWTVNSNGYIEFDEVVITNGEFEISAGLDRATCGEPITLAAEQAGVNGVGVWTVLAGAGSFTNVSSETATVTNLAPGPNVFRWTVTKNTGCVDSDLVTVTYNTPPVAHFEASPTAGCSPLTVEYINGSSGGVAYYWNFGEDQQTDSSLTSFSRTYIAYNTDSVYTTTLIAYSAAGCSDTTTQVITAYGIPRIGFDAYPDYQIYPDATVNIDNFSEDGYANYYWTWGDGETNVDTQMETGFGHTYATWGVYTITLAVNSGNCNDTIRETIEIAPPNPKDNGGRNHTGCQPLGTNLIANVAFAQSYNWVIETVDGIEFETATTENPPIIFEEPGTYYAYLSVVDFKGDTLNDIRIDTIIVYPNPVVDFVFQPDSVMLPNQAVHFYNQTLYGDFYEWEFGDGSDVSTEVNPLHYYTEEGTYRITLRAYTENECFGSLTKDQPVIVEPPGVCKFPNAFSPSASEARDGWRIDGDVSNDVFLPVHRGVGEYKLEIFNRWGEKIFESTNPDFGWNGYVNGKLAPQDVYVWKVTGKYKNGVIFKDAGDCTLLR